MEAKEIINDSQFIMKKVLSVLLISGIFNLRLNAQVYPNYGEPGQFYTYPDYDKFVGKWKYQNGNDTLIIELKKVIETYGSYTTEALIGYHHYVKNDTLYDDSFDLIAQRTSWASLRLSTYTQTPYNPNFLKGTVQNRGTKRIRYLQLEYLSNENIKWTTWAHVTPIRYNSPVPSYANALPTEAILIKQ